MFTNIFIIKHLKNVLDVAYRRPRKVFDSGRAEREPITGVNEQSRLNTLGGLGSFGLTGAPVESRDAKGIEGEGKWKGGVHLTSRLGVGYGFEERRKLLKRGPGQRLG